MLTKQIKQLLTGQSLSASEAEAAMDAILSSATQEQIAALLALLQAKGEDSEELLGFANAIRNKMTPIPNKQHPILIDIVGTGGDGTNSVNISTMTAIALASFGLKVAKHGNRSASSKCGSADFIEALQIPIDMGQQEVQQTLNDINFAFLFAPNFHPALKKVSSIRKNLKIRTVFNLLGPLINPASPTHSIIGVYDEKLMPLFAEIVCQLPIENALIVHSCGTDEISCLGDTKIIKITGKQQKSYSIHPNDVGLPTCTLADLEGGDCDTNKTLLLEALQGKEGGIKNTIILNMAIALKLVGQCGSIKNGIKIAKNQIDSGKAFNYLSQLQSYHHPKAATHA